jgi:4-hydroxybenzoate polyprenyltransferase
MPPIIRLFRPNRTIMVALITGAGAWVGGAPASRALLMTLVGWLLAVGGFSLDFFADRDLVAQGPRAFHRLNPLADGTIAPRIGLLFSLAFIGLSFIALAIVSPRSLLLWLIILIVLGGLALHLFESPIARALTLGLLQMLYVLMGGSATRLTPALWIISGMFFFAMFGGRGVTDIRDFAQDKATRVRTLPMLLGMRGAAWFTFVNLVIAFCLSYAAWLTGEFTRIYLYLDYAFITLGMLCAVWFVMRPSPKMGLYFTYIFMMGEGMLIILAMVLGRR